MFFHKYGRVSLLNIFHKTCIQDIDGLVYVCHKSIASAKIIRLIKYFRSNANKGKEKFCQHFYCTYVLSHRA